MYSQTSIIRASVIRSFWGQNLVRLTYMKYSQISIIVLNQNLVRSSTADNRGPTVANILLCIKGKAYYARPKLECHEKQHKRNEKTGTSNFKSAKVDCHEEHKGNVKTGTTSDLKSAKVECHEKQHKGNDKTGTTLDIKSAKVECHEEQRKGNDKTMHNVRF